MAVIEITIWEPLVLGQTISTLPYYSTIIDKLELTDSVTLNQHVERVDDWLVLRDHVTYHYGVHSISIRDELTLTQSLAPVTELRVVDTLTLTQSIDIPTIQHLHQSLVIKEYIRYSIRPRLIVRSQLELIQTLSVELVRFSFDKLISDYSNSCADEAATVRFTNPITSQLITLPRPEFADSIDQQTTRINQKSRGLSPIVFAVPFWPKSKVHKLTFSTLTDVARRAFANFYRQNYGLSLRYIDLQGKVHAGIITTPELEFVEHNDCAWGVSIEFTEL